VTYAQAKQADILNIPDARFYVSETKLILDLAVKANQRRNLARGVTATRYFLAISGGGDDGAFGAGLLVGWSDRGDRPEFDVVTGVSTGSLSAPFVFLGRAYDPQLKAVYTETNAGDVFTKNAPLIGALAGDSLTNNAPLRAMITRLVRSSGTSVRSRRATIPKPVTLLLTSCSHRLRSPSFFHPSCWMSQSMVRGTRRCMSTVAPSRRLSSTRHRYR
jgi:hypothetical protein